MLARLARRLIHTDNDYAALFARIALGLVIFPHGAQKLLGWFGGFGFEGTMGFFVSQGIPSFLAFLVIVAESLGALALVFGLVGRVAAFGIGTTMAVAMLTVHLPNGFFMNWMGKQAGEGIEYFLLTLGLAAVVLIRGSGALSLDLALGRWLESRRARVTAAPVRQH
jgi:putative oxidoreductase